MEYPTLRSKHLNNSPEDGSGHDCGSNNARACKIEGIQKRLFKGVHIQGKTSLKDKNRKKYIENQVTIQVSSPGNGSA